MGILWIVPSKADGAPIRAALTGLSPAAGLGWIAVRAAGACLVIPLVEELAFRGFLLPWLSSGKAEDRARDDVAHTWTWSAVVVSSLAFGALHDRWLLGTLAGLAFAGARLYRGRLGDAVLAHAVANAVVTMAVLGFGRWELWS